MASLTDWESNHLRSVYLLLQQATGYIEELEGKEKEAIEVSTHGQYSVDDDMTVKLRYILFDLYSVLDYVYFMLYCHFSNDGKPDLYSKKGTQFGFPSKPSGVEDQQKFVKEKMTNLFGGKFEKESHFWKDIGGIILSVQPKLPFDARESDDILQAQESFALLHYYRNCATHKSLVQFVSRKSWVEINQVTRETKLVNERCEKEGYFYRELEKAGYWIYLPATSAAIRDADQPRLLVEVLHQLMQFVKTTSSNLLSSSLLLPRAKYILKNHMEGCIIDTKFKPTDGFQVAEVTATVQGEKLKMESSRHKLQPDAEEDACILLLQKLATKSKYPNPPYTHFTLKLVQPMLPACSVKKTLAKTYRSVLNELSQKLSSQQENKIRIRQEFDVPQVEEQYFEATATVCFETSAGDGLCTLTSHKHKERGKDSAIEAACGEVVNEAVRLGIFKLIS